MTNEIVSLFANRRSVRSYTGESIPEDQLKALLQVALVTESGMNKRAWEFILVTDPAHLQALTQCKVGSGKMMEKAGAAIVVAVDETKTDTWHCDGAIALANMHLAADAMGLGSCYINALARKTVAGGDVEEFFRKDMNIPENYRIVGLLAVGIPASKPAPYDLEKLEWSKVHSERF